MKPLPVIIRFVPPVLGPSVGVTLVTKVGAAKTCQISMNNKITDDNAAMPYSNIRDRFLLLNVITILLPRILYFNCLSTALRLLSILRLCLNGKFFCVKKSIIKNVYVIMGVERVGKFKCPFLEKEGVLMGNFKEGVPVTWSLAQSRGLDPDSVMPMIPEVIGIPYTKKTKEWITGKTGPSSESLKKLVRARILYVCGSKKGLQYWRNLQKKTMMVGGKQVPLLDNPGLAEFLRDFVSEEALDHLQRIPHPINLLTSIGLNADEKEIPIGDSFFFLACNDPMHMFARLRASVLEPFLVNKGFIRGESSVTGLGFGYAPEWRKISERLKKEPKLASQLPTKIVACDSNPDVSKWYAKHSSFMGGRIDFRSEDIQTTLLSLLDGSQSTIYMTGVASYCTDRLPALLPLVLSKLKPGGNFIFDLQIMDWSLERNIKVFGWQVPGFKPCDSLADAIELATRATKDLPLNAKDFYLDPNMDRKTPIGVVFRLQKKLSK